MSNRKRIFQISGIKDAQRKGQLLRAIKQVGGTYIGGPVSSTGKSCTSKTTQVAEPYQVAVSIGTTAHTHNIKKHPPVIAVTDLDKPKSFSCHIKYVVGYHNNNRKVINK